MSVRVLVADDDEVDRLAVRRHLRDFDYDVEIVEATDAPSALRLAGEQKISCAFVDMNMPGRDGLWLVRELRAARPTLPIIVLTGHGDEETAVSAMKTGATDYLTKSSLDATLLKQRLRQALRVGEAEAEAERHRRALEENQRLLHLIVDTLPVLVAYVDRERTYRWTNRGYEDWFGRRRDELIGLTIPDVIGAEAYEAVQEHVDAALRGETVSFERDVPYAAGGTRCIEASYVPHITDGRVAGFVSLIRDIADRRRHDEQIARQRAFEQELIGIVSHDLRNPISVMMLAAATLQRRADVPEAARPALARIVSNGERSTRMISDLLDFTQARLGGGIPIRPAALDLRRLAEQAVDESRQAFPAREFVLSCAGDTTGEWDGDRILQILINLLANAAAYGAARSPVEVGVVGDAERVRVSVYNRGEPLAPDLLPVVFEPFRRGYATDSTRRSIGLGLYIVKQLVDAHGGTVSVTSLADVGTTFVLSLPRRQDGGRTEARAER